MGINIGMSLAVICRIYQYIEGIVIKSEVIAGISQRTP